LAEKNPRGKFGLAQPKYFWTSRRRPAESLAEEILGGILAEPSQNIFQLSAESLPRVWLKPTFPTSKKSEY
jgi:hypothetical protein